MAPVQGCVGFHGISPQPDPVREQVARYSASPYTAPRGQILWLVTNCSDSYRWRMTATTLPLISRLAGCTRMGATFGLAGWRRTQPSLSR